MKKQTKKPTPKPKAAGRKSREDVYQAAARVVREATEKL